MECGPQRMVGYAFLDVISSFSKWQTSGAGFAIKESLVSSLPNLPEQFIDSWQPVAWETPVHGGQSLPQLMAENKEKKEIL